MTGLDVSGKLINLGQLDQEMRDGSVDVGSGLVISGPGTDLPREPADNRQPPGSVLVGVDADAKPFELAATAVPILDAHVALRDKTDAEYATEFQAAGTSAARKQDIRDITAGLLPREQVPM